MSIEIERIFVDMDDTMCDYTGAYDRDIVANPGIAYPQSQHNFYRDLVVLDQSTWYLKGIADFGHDIWFLTRPSHENRLCYTEKADWIYRYMGKEWVEKLIICSDKSLLKGDFLIDDKEWPAFEGTQILYNKYGPNNWKTIYNKMKNGEYKSRKGLI